MRVAHAVHLHTRELWLHGRILIVHEHGVVGAHLRSRPSLLGRHGITCHPACHVRLLLSRGLLVLVLVRHRHRVRERVVLHRLRDPMRVRMGLRLSQRRHELLP